MILGQCNARPKQGQQYSLAAMHRNVNQIDNQTKNEHWSWESLDRILDIFQSVTIICRAIVSENIYKRYGVNTDRQAGENIQLTINRRALL